MKKLVAFLFGLTLLISTRLAAQSYPYISDLRGLEDSQNNTHLFYRYFYPSTTCWSKSIYHFDVENAIDTFFISDNGYQVIPEWGCQGDYVIDYEFFNNDPSKFIYCGYNLDIDPVALLRRYDGDIQLQAFALDEIEISKQNENLVYVSAGPGFFKSIDGGYNFELNDSMQFIDESIISLSKTNDTQIYGINDSKLVRSENDGLSYYIVDNSFWRNDAELFYDNDQSHIIIQLIHIFQRFMSPTITEIHTPGVHLLNTMVKPGLRLMKITPVKTITRLAKESLNQLTLEQHIISIKSWI